MEAEQRQLIITNPKSIITFHISEKSNNIANLRIESAQSEPLIFKVKTTAPQRYAVRPNAGILQPSEIVDVVILLEEDVSKIEDVENCKDKFMVRAAMVSQASLATKNPDVEDLWMKTNPKNIIDYKFKVSIKTETSRSAPVQPGNLDTVITENVKTGISVEAMIRDANDKALDLSKKLMAKANEIQKYKQELEEAKLNTSKGPLPDPLKDLPVIPAEEITGIPVIHAVLMLIITFLSIRMVV